MIIKVNYNITMSRYIVICTCYPCALNYSSS